MKLISIPAGFCLFLILLLNSSCNKNQDFEDYDILIDKEWRLNAILLNGAIITQPCNLDDILIFEDKSDFNDNFGALECPENSDVSIKSRTWKLKDDDTVLKLKYQYTNKASAAFFSRHWKIIELTENTLILEDDTTEENQRVEVREYIF